MHRAGDDQRVDSRVDAAFEQALQSQAGAVWDSYYVFAGRSVRLRVAGEALAQQVNRAFAHLRANAQPKEPPALSIDLWDESDTGVPHPSQSTLDRGSRCWTAGGGLVTSFDDGRVFRYTQPGSVTWLDRGARRIIGSRASGQRLAVHERSKPLTLLLDIWYYDRDIHVIHAGFVAWQGQGVLVGGASGDGKTTTTLACLLDGFDYLADDQTGLQALEDGSFAGHSLYSGARLEPRHAKNFLRLLPNAIPSDRIRGDKVLVFLTEALPEQVARRAPVRAIILPRVIPQERSFLRRASETEALLRLAPSSLFTAFGPGRRGFERLARLVERVPSYWLELGSDLAAIPGCVRGLLNGSLPQH